MCLTTCGDSITPGPASQASVLHKRRRTNSLPNLASDASDSEKPSRKCSKCKNPGRDARTCPSLVATSSQRLYEDVDLRELVISLQQQVIDLLKQKLSLKDDLAQIKEENQVLKIRNSSTAQKSYAEAAASSADRITLKLLCPCKSRNVIGEAYRLRASRVSYFPRSWFIDAPERSRLFRHSCFSRESIHFWRISWEHLFVIGKFRSVGVHLERAIFFNELNHSVLVSLIILF